MSRAAGEISPLAWLWNCLHARSGSLRCRAHSERLTVCRALIFRRYPNIVCEFLVRARCRGNVAAERVRQATVGFAIAVVGMAVFASSADAAPALVGGPIQVNPEAAGDQCCTGVAMAPDGHFGVAYEEQN